MKELSQEGTFYGLQHEALLRWIWTVANGHKKKDVWMTQIAGQKNKSDFFLHFTTLLRNRDVRKLTQYFNYQSKENAKCFCLVATIRALFANWVLSNLCKLQQHAGSRRNQFFQTSFTN